MHSTFSFLNYFYIFENKIHYLSTLFIFELYTFLLLFNPNWAGSECCLSVHLLDQPKTLWKTLLRLIFWKNRLGVIKGLGVLWPRPTIFFLIFCIMNYRESIIFLCSTVGFRGYNCSFPLGLGALNAPLWMSGLNDLRTFFRLMFNTLMLSIGLK